MLNERLQIMISLEQRRRLESEAKRRGSSVAMLVREAIDARFGATTAELRLRAVDEIGALGGRFLAVADLEQVVDEEREAAARGA